MPHKPIIVLNNRELKKVIKVLSSNQLNDALNKLENDCSGYDCCTCDTKSGDHCSCNEVCSCPKYDSEISLDMAEIYESLRNADSKKIMATINKLKEKQQSKSNKVKDSSL